MQVIKCILILKKSSTGIIFFFFFIIFFSFWLDPANEIGYKNAIQRQDDLTQLSLLCLSQTIVKICSFDYLWLGTFSPIRVICWTKLGLNLKQKACDLMPTFHLSLCLSVCLSVSVSSSVSVSVSVSLPLSVSVSVSLSLSLWNQIF